MILWTHQHRHREETGMMKILTGRSQMTLPKSKGDESQDPEKRRGTSEEKEASVDHAKV